MRYRALKPLMATLITLLSACNPPPDKPGTYKGYSLPKYTVLKQEAAFELREYTPRLVAEVTVIGNREDAVGDGFRILADYIFGGNIPQQKITMTSPVNQSLVQGERIAMTTPVAQYKDNSAWRVQFGMPAEYTLETLPKPKDARVKLYMTTAEKVAVIRFSGRANDALLAQKQEALENWVTTESLTLTGKRSFVYYDDPFTLPSNRRNEVMLEIK